ncbi:alpha/beta hydrolase [Phyllobacterium leguminum]|uniref:Acetyl esterase/lipase n=1 Tax=Phyllobacterium leguminum TaxID=314237 RepID=A0A318T265_9HYPH|nr:alpha/beta hydrolase [Phyllobacterium leguminum]PYE86721.1 acetyl esterase/lipase [Phyllobacterium leguminum]
MTRFLWAGGIAILFAGIVYAAFQLSPWPGALLLRYMLNAQDARLSRAMEKHVPPGVAVQHNLQYEPHDSDALLDVYYPTSIEGTDKELTTVVWVHGGGWISGSKETVAPYARILAAKGYTVISVGYSIAPGKTYPVPVRQVNAALGYLVKNARKFHIDPSRFVLAGDSAGAQIAAQVANIVSVPDYAATTGIKPALERSQLRAVMLFCGAYDLSLVHMNGPFRFFLKSVLWSYTGVRDYAGDPRFAPASVVHYVTSDFPPAFISAGNADPLLPQSVELVKALTAKHVPVDSLFFPENYKPPLQHEHQFDLDNDAGKLVLSRALEFLARLQTSILPAK